MVVSVNPPTAAPKKQRRTLRAQLDDALADAAALEAEFEEYVATSKRVVLNLETNLDEANDKNAVQAQELVSLREQLAEANEESAHNAQAASLLTQQVDAAEAALEKQWGSMMDVINERGDVINAQDLELEELRAENARLRAAEYLHGRPSYIRGALSAFRAAGRLLARGGAR